MVLRLFGWSFSWLVVFDDCLFACSFSFVRVVYAIAHSFVLLFACVVALVFSPVRSVVFLVRAILLCVCLFMCVLAVGRLVGRLFDWSVCRFAVCALVCLLLLRVYVVCVITRFVRPCVRWFVCLFCVSLGGLCVG